MTSQEFKAAIIIKRPRYANSRIPVIEVLANKGSRTSDYSQFGPIYELYTYAFMLGLKKDFRLPLPPREHTSDFGLGIGNFRRESSLVDFLLMVLFNHNEEIGFDWNELEDMEEPDLNKVVSNIISFMEEYANGGLHYLQELMNNGKLENSHYMFIDLYK